MAPSLLCPPAAVVWASATLSSMARLFYSASYVWIPKPSRGPLLTFFVLLQGLLVLFPDHGKPFNPLVFSCSIICFFFTASLLVSFLYSGTLTLAGNVSVMVGWVLVPPASGEKSAGSMNWSTKVLSSSTVRWGAMNSLAQVKYIL